ncbi:ATP-binding protein [Vibrio sp. 10N.261.52.F3]|uniref:ATP-binding protein n=1 Tax=Vibrio sp. 10N.261.52.F3 TaxID=3229683 RepID=UPI00354F9859
MSSESVIVKEHVSELDVDLSRIESLRIKHIAGKSVLLVGTELKTFIEYFKFENASSVKCISLEDVPASKQWLGESFENDKYDIVVLLFSPVYNCMFKKLVDHSLSALLKDGVLCVECCHHSKSKQISAVKINRYTEHYACKLIGKGGNFRGKPIELHVYHYQHKKPYAFLLIGPPGVGKTTMSKSCFSHLPIVHGDQVYRDIPSGKVMVSVMLREKIETLLREGKGVNQVARDIFELGYMQEMTQCWLELATNQSFVLDSRVPEKYLNQLESSLKSFGYIPVLLRWESNATMENQADMKKRVKNFSAVGEPIRQSNKWIRDLLSYVGKGFRMIRKPL